jgi:predicted AlkP superfamily pyrophosphatase or phosphodiesterase
MSVQAALGATATAAHAPVLLISLDGFRADYCGLHPEETPHLRQLQREGVSARGLIPSFPSQTFTSHYSIVTGLYPAHHGIIGNNFFDPELGAVFNYRNTAAQRDAKWWKGEPIWITAVKQGRRSACYFWVGSEVAFGDHRATIVMPFDYRVSFEKRFEELFQWLALPGDQRPDIITFYLEETNSTAHYQGIDSDATVAAIKLLDERIGRITRRARLENIPLNLVIVSDHGMAPTNGQTKTIILDDYVDLKNVQVDFDGPIAGLRPLDGDAGALVRQLAALPATYKVYRAEDLPERWHLRDNPRIPAVWVVSEQGWRIQRRAAMASTRDYRLKGEHGYDNALELMRGIFIAHGPAFKSGVTIEPVENIHVYNLLCATLGIQPAPNDGDDRLTRAALVRP